MDLARGSYSRDFKISVMRAMDAGESGGRVARRLQLSPKLIERWRGEWRARGEASFPGSGRRALPKLAAEERSVAELERKIGQLTLENDFLKKPCSISGSIIRRPWSVARLRVPPDPASQSRRCASEAAVHSGGSESSQLLSQPDSGGQQRRGHGGAP